MHTRTKIICTIGPSVDSEDKMIALIDAGMNVARLNFSHGTYDEHALRIAQLKSARSITKRPLAIMADTKGPEVRLGPIEGKVVMIPEGHHWLLSNTECLGNKERVFITPPRVLADLELGQSVLFDDGYVESVVIGRHDEGVVVRIINGGPLSSNKGVNIPNCDLKLPALTEKDIADIKFCCEQDVDLIAASFVRSPEHVVMLRKLLADQHKPEILIIAKIENNQGVKNIDQIVQAADGIMIARGDLGVEVPLSEVPRLQKMMIRKCYLAGKPSVTATQMLESMIVKPRPTRAEASDVANAIYDSTSSVMLSGETAIGEYPLETVRVMRRIVQDAESDFDYKTFFQLHGPLVYNDVPSAVTLAAVKTAYSSNAQAIFAFTTTGSTARLISRLRPPMPIIAMTHDEKCYHQLAFNWGVIPFLCEKCHTIQEAFDKVSSYALEKNFVSYGDLVVLTAGSPFGVSGTTNMMIVESIGEVLARGHKGVGTRVYGKVVIAHSPDEIAPFHLRNRILVIGKCDESYRPLIQEASGVVLQNALDDPLSEEYLLTVTSELEKPAITRADAAMRVIKDGQLVTLDPEKALVYKGVVL